VSVRFPSAVIQRLYCVVGGGGGGGGAPTERTALRFARPQRIYGSVCSLIVSVLPRRTNASFILFRSTVRVRRRLPLTPINKQTPTGTFNPYGQPPPVGGPLPHTTCHSHQFATKTVKTGQRRSRPQYIGRFARFEPRGSYVLFSPKTSSRHRSWCGCGARAPALRGFPPLASPDALLGTLSSRIRRPGWRRVRAYRCPPYRNETRMGLRRECLACCGNRWRA